MLDSAAHFEQLSVRWFKMGFGPMSSYCQSALIVVSAVKYDLLMLSKKKTKKEKTFKNSEVND